MRFSDFSYVFDLGDTVCLYHSLFIKKVLLNKAEWRLLEPYYKTRSNIEDRTDLVLALYKEGLLVENDDDERTYGEAQRRIISDIDLDTLIFVPTKSCNMQCEYCYAKSYLEPPKHMDKRVALKALETFAKQSQAKPVRHILFLGGEPLLAPDVIDAVIEKSQELLKTGLLRDPTGFAIATNGTLISEEIIKKSIEYGIFFGVSLDGRKQHNAFRKRRDGTDVFKLVVQNLKRLYKAKCDFSIDATVTTLNVYDLDAIVEYFITEFEPNSIGLTLIVGEENAAIRPDPILTTDKIISAYEKAKSYGVSESRITIQLESFCNEHLRDCECRITNSQIVINPDGKIGPSQELISDDQWFLTSDLNHFDLHDNLFLKFELANPFFMQICKNCPAIGICGGGSQYSRLSKNKSLEIPHEYYCTYAKRVLNWMINQLSRDILSTSP